MTNKQYNFLKWCATVIIPAFIIFLIAIWKAWDLPQFAAVVATGEALNIFIGSVVNTTSAAYSASNGDAPTEKSLAIPNCENHVDNHEDGEG